MSTLEPLIRAYLVANCGIFEEIAAQSDFRITKREGVDAWDVKIIYARGDTFDYYIETEDVLAFMWERLSTLETLIKA